MSSSIAFHLLRQVLLLHLELAVLATLLVGVVLGSPWSLLSLAIPATRSFWGVAVDSNPGLGAFSTPCPLAPSSLSTRNCWALSAVHILNSNTLNKLTPNSELINSGNWVDRMGSYYQSPENYLSLFLLSRQLVIRTVVWGLDCLPTEARTLCKKFKGTDVF